jgi:hypothetical protein
MAAASSRFASTFRTASGSRCGVTVTRARAEDAHSLHASMSEAWLPASETIRRSFGAPSTAASAVTTVRLARYPEEKTSAPAAPVNSASAASSRACSAVVPVTSREPVEPVPHTRAASAAAALSRSSPHRPR